MRIPNLVLLLSFSVLLILASPFILHAADSPECATCEELINAPETGIFVLVNDVDESNRYITIRGYYNNLSASPSRQNLSNSIVLVELTSPTGTYVLQKTYTDISGTAKFDFTDYDAECLNFKVLYCPFCVPPEEVCEGFKQCVQFGNLDTPATNADAITTAPDAVVLSTSELNTAKYLPSLGTASWCPPPPALAATPALCFPLILIFSLLSGALYLTGRNPFAGFNIGGMRTGQHIRYQARGRGFSFSFAQLAMAAMSVGEAVQTARKQGGGALVKREVDAANARGVGGIWTHNAGGGKSGFVPTIKSSIGQYQAGRGTAATARTGQAAAGGKGKGKAGTGTVAGRGGSGSSTSTGTGGASLSQSASGMQAGLSSGQGVSGRDILGGNVIGVNSILRIATFICLNTTLGRAIDALYTASTYNAEAGRGRNLFDQAFADRSGRVVDAAATLAQLRGPNGGTMVRVLEGSGEGRMVEAMPVPPGRPAVPEGQTEYAIAVPRGEGAGQSPTGVAIIRMNTNPDSPTRGQVLSVETTLRVPAVDGHGQPIMAMVPVLDKQGQPVMVPVLDKQGQPVMGDNGQPRMEQQMRPGTEQRIDTMNVRTSAPTAESNWQPRVEVGTQVPDPNHAGQTMTSWQNASPTQVSQITPQFNQVMAPLGPTFMPGVIAAPFVDSYNTHMQGVQALQQTIQSEAAFLREDSADRMRSELESNPDARDAVHERRYDVATEGVARLGIPENNIRTGDTGDLFSGVQRGESDLGGHTRSASETVVIAIHAADESAGPRLIGVPSLTSLAGVTGVSALGVEAGLSDSRMAMANREVPAILGGMSVDQLAHLTPAQLETRILASNEARTQNGLAPISTADAHAIAGGLAPNISTIATEFTGNLRSTPGFTGNTDQSGRTLLDRVGGTDLAVIATVGNAGHMVQAEGTGALLSRPDVYSGYRIPESIVQNAREYNALERVGRVSNTGDPVAAAGQINNAIFDYAQTVMVNHAGEQLPGNAYAHAGSGLDSSAHYSAITSTSFGELPGHVVRPQGLPDDVWTAVRPTLEARGAPLENLEAQRRDRIGELVTAGDYSTARAVIGDAVSDYNTAARAARSLGDEARARTLETAAAGYAHAYTQIDFCEGDTRSRGGAASPNAATEVNGAIAEYFPLTHPPPPPPPRQPADGSSQPTPPTVPAPPAPPRVGTPIEGTIYTVVDSASVAGAVDTVRATHHIRSGTEIDLAQQEIVRSIPREKRPPEMQDVARVNPLTPTIPGLGQGSFDST